MAWGAGACMRIRPLSVAISILTQQATHSDYEFYTPLNSLLGLCCRLGRKGLWA